MMGPMMAEMPLKTDVPHKASPACSGLPRAQSKEAFCHVEEKPPLYVGDGKLL